VIYLDVKGLTIEKAEAFITSTNIQIKAHRPDVSVKAAPENKTAREIFFKGEIIQNDVKSQPILKDYTGTQTYKVKTEGKTWKIGLRIDVNASVIKAKSKKFIKSFFKFFNKRTSKVKGWNLSDAVNATRKEVLKKNKGINDEDYRTFIENELLGVNIVFIEEIKVDELLVNSNND